MTLAARLRGELRISDIAAIVVLLTIAILCFGAPLYAPDPYKFDFDHALQGPSARHWLGSDELGRDLFSRIAYAGRIDLVMAICAAFLAFVIGTLIGLLVGYFRGVASEAIMRGVDVVQAFPVLILGLVLLTFYGSSFKTFVIILAVVNIPLFLRLARAQTLGVRDHPYIEAAHSIGASNPRILSRHVLPNIVTPGLVQITNTGGQAILIIGALSFLGVGVRPPKPEWGNMIQEGSTYILTGQWWISVFPGVAILITVMALHTVGEAFIHARRVR
jgi:peptide/nickel transport system permease protein